MRQHKLEKYVLGCNILFGNPEHMLFHLEPKALRMAGYLPVNVSENGDLNLGCESFPI